MSSTRPALRGEGGEPESGEKEVTVLKVYEVARSVARRMAPVCARIEARDGDLSRQARRAMSSVLLNMRKGSHSQGRNRNARYCNAAGSMNEVLGVLMPQRISDTSTRSTKRCGGMRRA